MKLFVPPTNNFPPKSIIYCVSSNELRIIRFVLSFNWFRFSIQSQCKEFGRVYEKSVRRLEMLEIDQKRSGDEIDRLKREIQLVSKEKSTLEEEIAFLKRRRPSNDEIRRRRSVAEDSRSEKKYSDERIRSQAIIIERNGQFSSPFLK